MTTTLHRLQSSSPAKADDPVFQSSHWEAHARRRLLDARVRGHDGKGFKKLSDKLRILITGFGPFPGAPFNPTQPLVARLLRGRCRTHRSHFSGDLQGRGSRTAATAC